MNNRLLGCLLRAALFLASINAFADVTSFGLMQDDVPKLLRQYLAQPFHSKAEFQEALNNSCQKNFWEFSNQALKAILETSGSGQTFGKRRSYLLRLIRDGAEQANIKGAPSGLKATILTQLKDLSTDAQLLRLHRSDVAALIDIHGALADVQSMDLSTLLSEIRSSRRFLKPTVEIAINANKRQNKMIASASRALISERRSGIQDNFIGYALLYWSNQLSNEDMVWMVRRMMEVWVFQSATRFRPDGVSELLAKTATDLSRLYMARDKSVYRMLKDMEKAPGWGGKSWRKHEIVIVREFLASIMTNKCETYLMDSKKN